MYKASTGKLFNSGNKKQAVSLPQICEIKLNIMNNYLKFKIFTFQILINKIFKNTPFPEILFLMPKVHQRLVLGQTSSEKGPSPPSQCHM